MRKQLCGQKWDTAAGEGNGPRSSRACGHRKPHLPPAWAAVGGNLAALARGLPVSGALRGAAAAAVVVRRPALPTAVAPPALSRQDARAAPSTQGGQGVSVREARVARAGRSWTEVRVGGRRRGGRGDKMAAGYALSPPPLTWECERRGLGNTAGEGSLCNSERPWGPPRANEGGQALGLPCVLI